MGVLRAEIHQINKSPINKSTNAHIALVTGTLAEPSMRDVAAELSRTFSMRADVIVLNIQVAALMTADWVARKLKLPEGAAIDKVILPGYLRGDVNEVQKALGVPVELGPKDCLDLPEHFGSASRRQGGYGAFDVEIIAEINHAAQFSVEQVLAQAQSLRAAGADVIDVGCDPGLAADRPAWPGLRAVVQALRDHGLRVSVDSLHAGEIETGIDAGAELVLSINGSNREVAARIGARAEVVVIPDDPRTLAGLDETIAHLEAHHVRYRIDPIIEPIGCGFATSLGRYLDIRRRFPQAAMMMGVGNLSEMTQVDSAGVNMLLMGFCQELNIRSVLTTQVINYARSSIAELDVARRLCRHAVANRMPPKHLDPRLVVLRDEKLHERSADALDRLQQKLTDPNYRIFAESNEIHLMNRDLHLRGSDPFALFDKLPDGSVDPSHAFYLGFEMAKALTALTLHKNYTQDQALNWGMHTRPEASAHERRRQEKGEA